MSSNQAFDVVVVGGGPAGSSAAYHLAQGGARVLVLDRDRYPREKACGDAISAEGYELLVSMGLKDQADRWYEVDRVQLTSPGGHAAMLRPTVTERELRCPIVPRREFDHVVLRAAIARGAAVWEECRVAEAIVERGSCVGVRGEREGKPFEICAPLVVAADGFHSSVARSFGIRHTFEETAFAVRAYFDTDRVQDNAMELHFDERVLPGYGWCFPCSPNRLNVGIGMRAIEMKERKIKLNDLFREFVATNRWVRERIGDAKPTRLIGAPLPIRPEPAVTTRNGCVFVGDAAGFVDALTGEGIAMAMHTGRMGATACLEALHARRFDVKALGSYDRAWKKRFGGTLRAAWKIQNGFADQSPEKLCESMDKVIEYASRKPAFGTFLCNLISGILPKTAAFSPVQIAKITLADALAPRRAA